MDTSQIGKQMLVMLALILANGIFAMTELAIVSARKPRLKKKADQGSKGARAALELAENPNLMFSTVQTGITLISIVTGLYGGATFSEPLAYFITHNIPLLAPYAETISPLIIVTVVTYLSLVIGELVPKRLAVNNSETLASLVGQPMKFFSVAAKPIVLFLSASSTAIIRALGIKPKPHDPITEEEIKIMLTQGAAVGAFEEEEPQLVDNIFRLADTHVADVLTPRTQLEWLDLDEIEEQLRVRLIEAHHNRLPVGRDSLDELVGLIHVSDIFTRQLETHETLSITELVNSCVRDPLIVAETISLFKLLSLFKTENVHEAIVLDELGSFSGFVTLHDIMEEIVGGLPASEDEFKEEESRIIQRTETSWYIDGLLNVLEFREHFHIEAHLPGEDEDLYKTVGGFMTYIIGRIPKEADSIHIGDYIFEVADMDNTRVDKILLTYEEPEEESFIDELLDTK